MPTFIFNKLVRDGLPEMYAEMGQTIESITLKGDERERELIKKLGEEARELCALAADDVEGKLDELADIAEIMKELGMTRRYASEKVEQRRQERHDKKGGFRKGIFVKTITLQPDDPWVEYYRREPEKYQEVDDII